MSGFIAKTACSALCAIEMRKFDMLQDVNGRFWCPEHANRGKLLNWALEHNCPPIRFYGKVIQFYPVQGLEPHTGPFMHAIGFEGCQDNESLWKYAIIMGNNDMIDAAIAYIDLDKEPLPVEEYTI